MKALISSHMYQIRKMNLVKFLLFVFLFLQTTLFLGEMGYYDFELSFVEYLNDNGLIVELVAVMYPAMIIGLVCASDFMDKTLNYELMSGHTRLEVFISRVIASFIYGLIGYILILFFPGIVGVGILGVKTGVPVSEIIIRALLSVLPAIRIMAIFVFLSFLIKNSAAIMVGGFMLFLVGPVLAQLMCQGQSMFTSMNCFFRLAQFESWTTYTLQDTVHMIRVFEDKISGMEIFGLVTSSIIIGAAFIALGYQFFKKDDLR